MTFRIYLRTPDQQVSDKTVTENRTVAIAAFTELVNRSDLDGKDVLAVLNQDGKPVAHHSFLLDADEQPLDVTKWWRGRVDAITS
jgi:hypothetical protein